MDQPSNYYLRSAESRDVEAIVGLIRELAEFEELAHLVQATPEKLRPHLFGERPAAEALVVEVASARKPGTQTSNTADRHDASTSGAEDRHDAQTTPPEIVGFALFFTNFSTFLTQPGLYLEDLYVRPAHRGQGIGEAVLTRLARLALERGYGRFEWSVLDWNENAIRFYERMGATVMPDWRICRISGAALDRFRT